MTESEDVNHKDFSEERINNPCVRNCCLDDTDICLGCFRTLNEILSWRKMTDGQRQEALRQCEERRKKSRPFI
jgi:predicted Fe-S protein YdhL (DUF1289 family)